MNSNSVGLQFHTAVRGMAAEGRLSAGRKRACALFLLLSLLSLAMLLLLPAARESAKLLANLLFEASEAVNAYTYERYIVAPNTGMGLAAGLFTLSLLSLYGLAVFSKRHLTALLLAIGLAAAEVYYGLTPRAWINLLLFGILAAAFLWDKRSPALILSYAACILLIAGLVSAALPGVNAKLEARSETWRDRLSSTAQTAYAPESPQSAPDTGGARHENRLDIEDGNVQDNGQTYEIRTEYEQRIARPPFINWLSILLVLLLILLILTLPFLPFFLAGKRRKKALDRRRAFGSEDDAEAIRAMFTHCVAYIESRFGSEENCDYAKVPATAGDRLPGEYLEDYASAAQLFEEAAYSGRDPGAEKRRTMSAFLDETEELLYDRADRKSRLRMKYVECLHE